MPALTTLATAATARKRRRVGSTGGNIIGWSIADVFVGGVLSTLSAWVIWNCGPYWLGLEPGRKTEPFPSACFSVTPKIMKKSIKVTPKKRRGRPATGRDPHVTSRMPPELIAEVEAWAVTNDTSRSDAFRRLVELGLSNGKRWK